MGRKPFGAPDDRRITALAAVGLGIGIISAAVAVLPAILSPAIHLPWRSLGLTLGAVLVNGLLWAWLATRCALRGNLLAAFGLQRAVATSAPRTGIGDFSVILGETGVHRERTVGVRRDANLMRLAVQ